jgi:alkanesulfonate monooxygenase SsuD/methylene tetrahydromethanopterin reductase-like flavin-dependent oxidoreductase (luciferase family)
MLDQLSGGRLEVGIGRGISPIELSFHGIKDASEARQRYEETLALLLESGSGGPLTHSGEYYSTESFPMELAFGNLAARDLRDTDSSNRARRRDARFLTRGPAGWAHDSGQSRGVCSPAQVRGAASTVRRRSRRERRTCVVAGGPSGRPSRLTTVREALCGESPLLGDSGLRCSAAAVVGVPRAEGVGVAGG